MEIVSQRTTPPVVYVPINGEDHEGRASIALLRLTTGQLAVAAYSALDRLESALGARQAWMLFRTPELEEQASAMNITRILMDPRPDTQPQHRGGLR
ncbi:SAV_915 family protein [Microbacterium sp. NPDC076768]|uniref:SAV_915 family protein n=1 Tax=Microbacterium sp. NPDC076768 TaxID=3154858 RepID=UPI00342528D7